MKTSELSPWSDEQSIRFLSTFESWANMAHLIQTTLKQDPRKYPHQIRAACAVVIMICRDKLWPERSDLMTIDDVVSLARRQLAQVKHQFSIKARINTELKQNPKFRRLLDSIDQEMRILESRVAEEPLDLPQEPPASWGQFWSD